MNGVGSPLDWSRRGFLRAGSAATVFAAMGGGVEILAQTEASPPATPPEGAPLRVGVIGLGAWGREIISTLARVPGVEVAAVCDRYPALMRRAVRNATGAAQLEDYRKLLADKSVSGVVVATPTHSHRAIAVEALQAGKHVYCEVPLAGTLEDARAVAQAAAAAGPRQVFQAGLQYRSDDQHVFIYDHFIRTTAIGRVAMVRGQWNKKQSWRATALDPDREREANWRLARATSLGLVGELGIHQLDVASWYLGALPEAVSGFGAIVLWDDGRDVADTVQSVLEYPGRIRMLFSSSLANSFEAETQTFYGADAAILLRGNRAWLFKEADAPHWDWEVHARRETLDKETGIALRADASKLKPTEAGEGPVDLPPLTPPLQAALGAFAANVRLVTGAAEDFVASYGAHDPKGLAEALGQVTRRPAAGYREGYAATVTVIKVEEAISTGQRVEFKKEWFELG